MKKLILLSLFLIITVNLFAQRVSIDVVEDNPDLITQTLDINLYMDLRTNTMMDNYPMPNPSDIGINIGLGLSYRLRPHFPIGLMIDVDLAPYGFTELVSGSFEPKQTLFKVWDVVIDGGLLFQVYDKTERETQWVTLSSVRFGNYTRTYYVTVPDVKVRNVVSIRTGAIVELNNAAMFIQDANYIQQHYLVYAGVSWWTIRSLTIDILSQNVADRYGKRHRKYGHNDLFADVIVDTKSWSIGGRVGWHFTYMEFLSTLFELGYTANKGPYYKITFGANFSFSKEKKDSTDNNGRNKENKNLNRNDDNKGWN